MSTAATATKTDTEDQQSTEATAATTNTIASQPDSKWDPTVETEGIKKILEALTDEEKAALADEHMPRRHLRAEDGDVDKAIQQLKETLAWRKEFGVAKLLACFHEDGAAQQSPFEDEEEKRELVQVLERENQDCKMYVRGYDQDGRAVLVMRPSQETTKNELNQMRWLVWNLEKAIACSSKANAGDESKQREKVCVIIDYDRFSIIHSPPLSTAKCTLNILQRHYPERCFRFYLCNPPFLFRSLWALVKPFIDPVTKEKIVFCHGEKGIQVIQEQMGSVEKLEVCAGGNKDSPVRPVDAKEYLSLPFDVTFDE